MWIKICGIRDVPTALAVAQAGADAIGLNFYSKSSRVVAPTVAQEIVAALPQGVEPIGLFVNHPLEEVRRMARECGLKTVQLHGDETVEMVAELAGEFSVIRAFRVGGEGLTQVAEEIAAYSRLGAKLWGCLLDAKVAGSYGGTGQLAPWQAIREQYQGAAWPRLIVAGGLNPQNVGDAVLATGAWGVDVAGGVESSVACKDLALVRKFVDNARRAGDPR